MNMDETQCISSEIDTFDSEDLSTINECKKKKILRIRKCNVQWTKPLTKRLIETVQKWENLWNPYHSSYKDRAMHQCSWESVSESLSLPKQEVILKWNSLRSNYRNFLKSQRHLNEHGESTSNKKPNAFYLAMSFLTPIMKFDFNKSESNLNKIENLHNNKSHPRSNSTLTNLDNYVLDIVNKNSTRKEVKNKKRLLSPEKFIPSERHFEDNSQQGSNSSTLSLLSVPERRNIETCDTNNVKNVEDNEEWTEVRIEDELMALKRSKLQLEIYNLQLDAIKKEIDLGLPRSELTMGLYSDWEPPVKQES